VVFVKKKLGWFDKVSRDDAAEFNAKYAQRKTAKAKNSVSKETLNDTVRRFLF